MGFTHSCFNVLIWLGFLCSDAMAQYGFQIPDPDSLDLNSALTVTQYTNQTTVWLVNSTYQPTVSGETVLDSNGHVSLWVTSFKYYAFTRCLVANIDSTIGGQFTWNVSISDSDIDASDGAFVYRIKPTVGSLTAAYDATEDECPSRGFFIEKASDVAASSGASAGSTMISNLASSSTSISATVKSTTGTTTPIPSTLVTSAQTGVSSTPNNTATATSISTAAPSSGGMNSGEKAGIAIGTIGAVSLIIIALLMILRNRQPDSKDRIEPVQNPAPMALQQLHLHRGSLPSYFGSGHMQPLELGEQTPFAERHADMAPVSGSGDSENRER
ncbi:hypothetical protein K490DRAFT_53358 [Saccharata proteae CBS 121410]|uniref:Mid2 domain-containing protein n=1 Tax=Saccharata proteae CBS 121410 TaxID=1314787 RepID=A0A9P4M3U4_9PEZI|nr:hypothetical protein K490DRAFT_53358 [Saccharata proteae CBS 121410]